VGMVHSRQGGRTEQRLSTQRHALGRGLHPGLSEQHLQGMALHNERQQAAA
jgi:hypothetical protein